MNLALKGTEDDAHHLQNEIGVVETRRAGVRHWAGLPEPDVQAMHDGTQAIPLIVERLLDVLCRNQRLEAMRTKRVRR